MTTKAAHDRFAPVLDDLYREPSPEHLEVMEAFRNKYPNHMGGRVFRITKEEPVIGDPQGSGLPDPGGLY